jgi:hypothetical protein
MGKEKAITSADRAKLLMFKQKTGLPFRDIEMLSWLYERGLPKKEMEKRMRYVEGILDMRERARDAQKYHKVMKCLLAMKRPHGICQPRERRACTACNAKDELDALLEHYKGQQVRLQGPTN